MKKFLQAMVAMVATVGAAWGGVQPTFDNRGVLTTPIDINATHFNNYGVIEFSLFNNSSNLSFNGSVANVIAGKVYNTHNTLYFTNAASGLMVGEPGFRFDDETTAGAVRPARSFANAGDIIAQDFPTIVSDGILTVPGNNNGVAYPPGGRALPSRLVINAQNVASSGTLQVGNVGLLSLTGRNVNLDYGILAAGTVSDSDTNSLFLNTASAEQYVWDPAFAHLFTADSEDVYDLEWGATNGLPYDISTIVTGTPDNFFINLPPVPVQSRGGFNFGGQFFGFNATAFAYEYTVGAPTNIYYNVVFVDTNVGPDAFVKVGFSQLSGFTWVPVIPGTMVNDANGIVDVVQFGEPVVDVITGQTVTNSIYLEDNGAVQAPVRVAQNVAYSANYSRPDNFVVTTAQPDFLADFNLQPANTTLQPNLFYNAGEFPQAPDTVPTTNTLYEVEVGRDPETLAGVFGDVSFGGGATRADFPDMTNEAARIELNATNLSLVSTRLRAEGLVTINSDSTTGMPRGADWGTANLHLGSVTNSLVVSNVVPTSFHRMRGDIEAESVTWVNIQTNASATNEIHYHILFISQNLQSVFTPTVRDFTLRSTNAVLEDNVTVINSQVFNTRNLTLDAKLLNTQNAADVTPASTPNLRNLMITTNGAWEADSLLDLGFNTKKPVAATTPVGRTYSILSITNEGVIVATAPTLQARTIENDGLIESINKGSVLLQANLLGLGLATNSSPEILSGGQVTLSANIIEATNSTIYANQLVLWPVRDLTDFVTGTLGTNETTVNSWVVTNELELPRKPVNGDLYGTEIDLVAKDGPPTQVFWSGLDEGDSLGGFFNNATIGHLVLDRTTNSAVMQFFATGKKNALYVNYLELRDSSFTDYHDNFFIDPHLTIYFAAANVPPNKLTAIFPNLIYASNAVSEEISSPDFVTRKAAVAALSSGVSQPGLSVAPAFTPVTGVYSGLFASPTKMSAENSGYFTFTLNKGGSFSGKMLLNSTAIPLSGRFDNYGSASLTTHGLSIQLLAEPSGKVVGEVTGNGWDAMASGAVSPGWTEQSPAPQAGSFLLALPGAGGSAPEEASYGTLRVNSQGVLTAAGRLADGSSFSQSTKVGQGGQWPFFAYAPSGKDVLLGWMNFAPDNTGVAGNVTWMKPVTKGTNYPSGFNVNVQAVGTATVPATGASK